MEETPAPMEPQNEIARAAEEVARSITPGEHYARGMVGLAIAVVGLMIFGREIILAANVAAIEGHKVAELMAKEALK